MIFAATNACGGEVYGVPEKCGGSDSQIPPENGGELPLSYQRFDLNLLSIVLGVGRLWKLPKTFA